MKRATTAAVFALLFTGLILAPGNATAATTLSVTVGGGASSIAANGFFPNTITIQQGDSIRFSNPYAEPHTTTFVPAGTAFPPLIVPGPSGPPQFTFSPQAGNATFTGTAPVTFDATKYYNTGIMLKDSTATLTFPKAGTYLFACLFHAAPDATGAVKGMTLSVKVVSSGTTDTQAAVDTRAASELAATLAAGTAAANTVAPPASEKLPDGSLNVHVVAGGETAPAAGVDADVMRFLPQNINIHVGDTVEWSNSLDVPHTISFGYGTPAPPLVVPLPQASGPPLLELNPQVFAPAGGPAYAGTGQVTTGAIGEGFAATSASLKFTKAGTYTYVCLIHADQSMMGTVTVAAAAAPPSVPVVAPNTGTGPGGGAPGGSWLIEAAVALAVAGGVSLSAAKTVRRR